MSTRRPLLLTAAVALLTVTAPAAVASTTVVGETFAPLVECGSPVDILQVTRADGISYAMPNDGVITSWSFEAGVEPAQLVLRVFRPTGAVNTYLVVGDGGPVQSITTAGPHTFPTRLPVSAGDIAGLSVRNNTRCASTTGNPVDKYAVFSGTLVAGQTAAFLQGIAVHLDISVRLESDADHDGFGDDTQDGCPTSTSSQASCTETTITKKPKAGSLGPKSKLRFASSVAGATFRCTLDGKRAKPCTSPATYRCLKPGKHTFKVVATSPSGFADPTPAKAKFKVSASRHGC